MAKKAAYTVVEFRMMPVDLLEPHPLAMIPIDDEDKASIERSIDGHNILHPLLISEGVHHISGLYRIYDGCNRWNTAKALGMTEVPCLLVCCEDPAMIVAECLSAGRKRTTGQRILVFLEGHKEEVLAARRMGIEKQGNIQKQLKNVQQNAGVSRETPGAENYTPEAVSTLLKCSRQDVISALELFESLHTETVPDNLSSGKRAHEADEAEIKLLLEQRNGVLSGHSPVRAWKRAFFGRQSTKGVARSPIDYASLLDRSLTGLLTSLPRWSDMTHDDRALFEEKFARVINALPADLKVLTK